VLQTYCVCVCVFVRARARGLFETFFESELQRLMKAAEMSKDYRTQSLPRLSQSPDKILDTPVVNNYLLFVRQHSWRRFQNF